MDVRRANALRRQSPADCSWSELCADADTMWISASALIPDGNDPQPIESQVLIMVQAACVCSLFTLLPPRRSHDFAGMIVLQNPTDAEIHARDCNMLLLDADGVPTQIVFKQYKTCKTYGCQYVTIPTTLATRVRIWIMYCMQLQPGASFVDAEKPAYFLLSPGSIRKHAPVAITPAGISALLRRNLKHGIRELRRAKITYTFAGDTSAALKQELAAQMGHSTETQQLIYRVEI